jgi:integral membrane sensor domain MASE1
MDQGPQVPREQWTMPPATLLSRPRWSTRRRVGMLGLGSYMVLALILLLVKTVQLAGG